MAILKKIRVQHPTTLQRDSATHIQQQQLSFVPRLVIVSKKLNELDHVAGDRDFSIWRADLDA